MELTKLFPFIKKASTSADPNIAASANGLLSGLTTQPEQGQDQNDSSQINQNVDPSIIDAAKKDGTQEVNTEGNLLNEAFKVEQAENEILDNPESSPVEQQNSNEPTQSTNSATSSDFSGKATQIKLAVSNEEAQLIQALRAARQKSNSAQELLAEPEAGYINAFRDTTPGAVLEELNALLYPGQQERNDYDERTKMNKVSSEPANTQPVTLYDLVLNKLSGK